VTSNASSYAYLDALRPVARSTAILSPTAADPAPAFATFSDAKNCAEYDAWPYGLKRRTGYGSKLTDQQITRQLAARPVTYLLGEADVLPLGVFDTSCPAMAQGPNRLARGLAFSKYINENHGARHNTIVVPFCSHSARCMFTSDVALRVIFPR
jgi:hypothetical protein